MTFDEFDEPDAVPAMTNTAPHHLGGLVRRRGDFLNLTDMYALMGRPAGSHPNEWLRRPDTRHHLRQLRHGLASSHPALTRPDPAGVQPDLVLRRGPKQRHVWAHWRLALAYAQFLSPAFHLWCLAVLGEHHPDLAALSAVLTLSAQLERQVTHLHHRFDRLDRHVADLMFLIQATPELIHGQRRDFSGRSRSLIHRVLAAPPFAGRCPCCGVQAVLTPEGQVAPGAQLDHFFARTLNRPEHGWLVCRPCHHALTHGSYLDRFAKLAQFRLFQEAVLAYRQAEQAATDDGAP